MDNNSYICIWIVGGNCPMKVETRTPFPDTFVRDNLKTGIMKEIFLNRKNGDRLICFYDDEDHNLISQYKWCYCLGYAITTTRVGKSCARMHRLILGIQNKSDILSDHINHNRLDNRRCNLRICNRTENNRNINSYGKVNYLGVCKPTGNSSFVAQIRENGKNRYLGSFNNAVDAAKIYDAHAKRIYGEFANLNFPS